MKSVWGGILMTVGVLSLFLLRVAPPDHIEPDEIMEFRLMAGLFAVWGWTILESVRIDKLEEKLK